MDNLNKTEAELAAVSKGAPDEASVGHSGAYVQTRAGKVEGGGDPVGLDRFADEALGSLEI
jgi:hypothetical protein